MRNIYKVKDTKKEIADYLIMMNYFFVGDSLLYIPPAYEGKFAQIYVSAGKCREVFSRENFDKSARSFKCNCVFLKEGKEVSI